MNTITMLEIGLSNLFIIKGDKTVILDTGCGLSTDEYKEKLLSSELDSNEVSLIVLSHGHFDHCAELDTLKEFTGAPVLCHKNAAEFLRSGKCHEYIPRGESGKKFLDIISTITPKLPSPTVPEISMEDEDFDLTPYGISGKLIYTPGHELSSIALVLDSDEAFVGDTLLENPFEKGKLTAAVLCENRELLKMSIERLFTEADVFYCGHGSKAFTKDEVAGALRELN